VNPGLERLFAEFRLAGADMLPVRLAFGLECVKHVEHLMEDPRAVDCLRAFEAALGHGDHDGVAVAALQDEAARLAQSHPGSRSIDGTGHASVSATHALMHAVAGRALQAADYAAYAAVYSYGGYAVKDPAAFEPEFEWQQACLRRLCSARQH